MSNVMNDSDLMNITGGVSSEGSLPKYPIGTEVLENSFSQTEGQDKGAIVAYGWPENGKYSYIVKWSRKGEIKYTEEEVKVFRMCWELTFG